MRVEGLTVSRVNDVNVEDLVTVKGDSVIYGSKHFVGDVFINDMKLKEEADLNFSPELLVHMLICVMNNSARVVTSLAIFLY